MTETHLMTSNTPGPSSSSTQPDDPRVAIFAELFSKHFPALYKIALRKLGNSADAEDAVQDALLSAFRHFDQFRGEARISTWLTAVVLNVARMRLRYGSRRRFVHLDECNEEGFAKSEMIADAGPDPEQIRRMAQQREVLERCAVKLSPKIRHAFNLRVLEGLSNREAAQRLGISEGTLKAQFFRARAQITPHLQRAFKAPAKSGRVSRGGQVREFVTRGVTTAPARSSYRRVA